ncbi:hypothetical protein VNO80_23187 [Phaseolus coccineus]|uniref:Uncharacterized protein n=1 Tax=Phaseolus coccineus TaxID=3886 RepID=A0AAN9QUQ9_PHACN
MTRSAPDHMTAQAQQPPPREGDFMEIESPQATMVKTTPVIVVVPRAEILTEVPKAQVVKDKRKASPEKTVERPESIMCLLGCFGQLCLCQTQLSI